MDAPVILRSAATPTAPALLLRPWCARDVAALVEVYRDPVLRRWAISRMDNEDEGRRWVRAQERSWAAGDRFAFAVLETAPDASPRLVGNVVLKEVASGKPSAEVGYWTAARARGRGIASRALSTLTAWSFEAFRAEGLECLELLHQVDNSASCRVAEKNGYRFDATLPAAPPTYPLDGHLHIRRAAA
ncbi:GNAT family N-acetyltransferase [Streptomyces candidus]|uniref:RimJ/RimL family protein N-acetyltransferase n=1 Tax=Streptomyces candidus TaxID=67283 RepID=A0A7X0HJ31_9ACTN|nr:GNAT family N-acetyltransferase [Streptomyces candidus]MBB6438595.1 RimJ/RimL family protein N-acetyltransferase [Streptomyces candidus]